LLGLTLTGIAMAAEEPRFTVDLKVGAFEVRDYPALVAAEVEISAGRRRAVNAGFRILASYIFGSNSRNQRIPMTAPVVQTRAGGGSVAPGDTWLIRFFMPGGSAVQSLPRPTDPRVRLIALPPTRFAVVRFSGLAHDPDVARSTADLDAFIRSHHLKATGPAFIAGYNPPWTPWFLRRNEIMVPVAVE
jgi:hypothetical protein